MSKVKFLAFDLETSGTSHVDSQIIQVGACFGLDDCFETPVKFEQIGFNWSEEAAEVHGVSLAEALDPRDRPTLREADALFYDWLSDHDGVQNKIIVPIGYNVGSFDMPFVVDQLPLSSELFSRRALDLNALCFALDQQNERRRSGNGKVQRFTWEAWKRAAKKEAISILGTDEAHDALWDAKAAFLAQRWLGEQDGCP